MVAPAEGRAAPPLSERAAAPKSSGTPPVRHLAFLDGVRGVACAYVALHHCFLDLPVTSSTAHFFRNLFSQGHCAVDVFIVLSGYCLMLPMLQSGRSLEFWPFIARRAIRILPTYYAAMALSLLFIGTIIGKPTGSNWDTSLPVEVSDVVRHLLLIHELDQSSMLHISPPFWSIAVEWKIYFLFPALVALRGRWGAAATALLALSIGYAVWAGISHWDVLNPSPWGSSPYYVGLFALGMWAADLSVSEKRHRLGTPLVRAGFAGLTALTLAIVLVNYARHWNLVPIQILSGFVGVWAAVGLALVRAGTLPRVERLLSWPPLVYLGKRGYTMYLIHAPIAQIVYQYVILRTPWSETTRALSIGPIFALATLAVAVPFYRIFERPFHELSRRAWREESAPVTLPAR
ncbi:MAG TPA: acyltransferase [Polyangiaceae bacterium]|nr:acyltransferase [Polyangiaceae bacterium]